MTSHEEQPLCDKHSKFTLMGNGAVCSDSLGNDLCAIHHKVSTVQREMPQDKVYLL